MSSNEYDDLADAPASDLDTDVARSSDVSDLASEIARGVKQRNSQQKFLFKSVCGLVCVSFIVTICLVIAIGRGGLTLSSSGQVAAIAAFGVQPFVLVGILTTNVYRGSAMKLGEGSSDSN